MPGLLLDGQLAGVLRLESFAQPRDDAERELHAFFFLRLTGLEAQPTSIQIDVPPPSVEQDSFGPASDELRHGEWSQPFGEGRQQRVELAVLDQSGPDVRLVSVFAFSGQRHRSRPKADI